MVKKCSVYALIAFIYEPFLLVFGVDVWEVPQYTKFGVLRDRFLRGLC